MEPETNEVQSGAVKSDEKIVVTGEQLEAMADGMMAKAIAKVKAEGARSETPDALKGLQNGEGVAAPAFMIKSLPYNPYEKYTDNVKGIAFARAARLKAAAQIAQVHVNELADVWAKTVSSEQLNAAVKATAMQSGSFTEGGALIEPTIGEFIGLIRESSVVAASGVVSMPLKAGMTMRRQTSPGTAYYAGERPSGNLTSKQAYAQEQIYPKKLIASTVLSNDLLRDAGPEADVLTRNDLMAVAGLRSDLAFIRGDGTQHTPKGIYHWTNSGNRFNSAGTTLDNVTADLEGSRLKVVTGLKGQFDPAKMVWLMSPRSESYLRRLRDSNGNLIYKPEMDMGKLLGCRYLVSGQIPDTLGSGNKSEIYLFATNHHIIFQNMDFELTVHPGAAYVDADGVQAGLSNDETVIQLIGRHDFFQRYDVAAAVIEAVAWGA
jgi:HK97 family phage major capsid protein